MLSESVNKEEPQTKPTKKAFDVLLPCLALAYLPFVFLVGTVSDGVDSYIVFVLSGAALLVLLPAYAVTIIIRAKEQIKNGKLDKPKLCHKIAHLFLPRFQHIQDERNDHKNSMLLVSYQKNLHGDIQ